MLPKSIEYFQNIGLPYGTGIVGSWASYFVKTPTQQLYENNMPEKVLDAALITTKQV